MDALLDSALSGFDGALRFLLQFTHVPAGSRIAVVDLYTPSLGREGLLLIQQRGGFTAAFDFDVHPTNAGHAFIAGEFAATWKGMQ